MNLYDLTRGAYTVHRTVSYQGLPESELVFETTVTPVTEREWSTSIEVSGTYDGPVDVVGVEDYRLYWTRGEMVLHEEGSATLLLASGDRLSTTWRSTITPAEPDFDGFPSEGETVTVDYSPFEIEGNAMSYEWSGRVEPADGEQR